ncbi:RMD1 family protein [Thiomicrorhabdus sp. zzn3]|uniref:RMD1 family protein n=1 Tax=Thiomicrorhabdus sp. zzn3 TaxID=3039775 RepID=UPI0024371881|nr:RMD1 family protein [Thiomicrorhabdus sp. zzn3]MDG6778539.1 RMD1 family protein [Thiomicrorhabdus sp. zzn3]
MNSEHVNLVSIYLPPDYSRFEIMQRLGIQLKKGIEACFYVEPEDNRYLFFTEFDVITFVNWPREQIVEALHQLDLQQADRYEEHYLFQDYPIRIRPDTLSPYTVDNECIELSELTLWPLMIVALVISQSVGLEKFEQEVDHFFNQGRQMVETSGRLDWMKRQSFAAYAKQITLLRHDMVLDLLLLDKPNILWDNPDYERLYNRLAELLELQERFEVVTFKLNTLKEDIAMMLELYNHQHSSFLEWIIIILILVEVVMGFLGIFGVIDH